MTVQEYTDAQTGVHMTVEHDVPDAPRVTVSWSEEGTVEDIEKTNEAIRRLLHRAGLEQEN